MAASSLRSSAEEKLEALNKRGLPDTVREAEESRVIRRARAFAEHRVHSTVRQLPNRRRPVAAKRPTKRAAGQQQCIRFSFGSADRCGSAVSGVAAAAYLVRHWLPDSSPAVLITLSSAVLHNDLRSDARLALRTILQERGALPVEPFRPVPVQIVTPGNIPA